jgi:glycosyltransferase involved in cell wall biosynthesis
MLTSLEPRPFVRIDTPPASRIYPVSTRRVLAITSNVAQASCRLRIDALRAPLAQRGFHLEIRGCPRDWNSRRSLLRSAGEYDAVLLHRKLLDAWNWKVLREHARRVVFDVDDAVRYHASRVGPYSLIRTALRFAATTRNVDHVVAGNPYLAEMFGQRGCQVSIVPTAIDSGRYPVKSHAPTESPRLVWIGSRSTVQYLEAFLPILEAAAKRIPGLRLLTIADATVTSRVLPIEHVPWDLHDEVRALGNGDIGIAPTPCDRWTLGKCGFKILQYMAAGLPVIASPVGANAELVQHGVTGLLPARPGDWFEAIATLAHDADLRARMGKAGRELAERRYQIDDVAEAWAELLAR